MIPYTTERSIALEAVAHANTIARRVQTDPKINTARTKEDTSPVTIADFAVQAIIVHRLHQAFPEDKFIAEESTDALNDDVSLRQAVASQAGLSEQQVLDAIGLCDYQGGDGKRTWILDPIDGTRGFINMRQYCIALALIESGIVRLGVLGCPNLPFGNMIDGNDQLGVIFHAIQGFGTYMLYEKDFLTQQSNPVSIRPEPPVLGDKCTVSPIADPVCSTFCESVETAHSSHEISARVAGILGVSAPPVRMDSQAKYGCIARGDFSIFLRFPRHGYVENVWDSAPACIIIEEAGGKVTDGRGRPLDFSLGRKMDNDDGIVATNGHVHEAVIEAVQQALQESKTD